MKTSENIQLLYIDLFCGAGGTSTGVENAIINGKKIAKVIACVNHDKNAIASHKANHPDAIHYTEDIRTLDLGPMVAHVNLARRTYPGAKVVLWASLECTNFSRAKGGMSRDADSRTLAEHLFRYVEAIDPDIVQIENVDEFQTWGPLIEKRKADGTVVMTKKSSGKGKDRKSWEEPAMLPDPEHKGEYYHRWVQEMCSYGYRFESRILNSADYGAYTSRRRFFGMFAKRGIDIVFPQPTHARDGGDDLFGGHLKPWLPVRDVLNLDDEGESIFDRKKPLVDATLRRIHAGLIKFVAGGKENFLIKWNSMNQNGKYLAPDIDAPCPTVSTQNRIGVGKARFLSKAYSGDPEGKQTGIDCPAGTITTKDHHQFITAYYGRGGAHSVDAPAPTITTKDRLAMVFLDNQYGTGVPSSAEEPAHTIGTIPKVKPVKIHFLDNQYGNSRCSSVDEPSGTVTTNPKQCLVEAVRQPWLMDTAFSNVGSSIDSPARVVTANRKWQYLVNPQFSCPGNSVNAPCPTVIARQDKLPLQIASASTETEHLPSFIKREGDSLVYIAYDTDTPVLREIKQFMFAYGIVDISMRMLRIDELKLIQGFPKDYVLVGTQEEQKKYLGNAVVTIMAKVWCEAIVPTLDKRAKTAVA